MWGSISSLVAGEARQDRTSSEQARLVVYQYERMEWSHAADRCMSEILVVVVSRCRRRRRRVSAVGRRTAAVKKAKLLCDNNHGWCSGNDVVVVKDTVWRFDRQTCCCGILMWLLSGKRTTWKIVRGKDRLFWSRGRETEATPSGIEHGQCVKCLNFDDIVITPHQPHQMHAPNSINMIK